MWRTISRRLQQNVSICCSGETLPHALFGPFPTQNSQRGVKLMTTSNEDGQTNEQTNNRTPTAQTQAPTFFHDYEVVSGGDWSIHRGGMVHFENATHSELEGCLLDAPGGNGVFLSGFSDGIEVHHNEIRFAGDSLVAAVGKTDYFDGR
jgi:hypothetical protein